jgi:HTTM domain
MSIDLRSLAALRMAYGLLLFFDTVVRWTDLQAHYSDSGVLSRADLINLAWNPNWFSIHMASGGERWLHLLFALQTFFALALLVGWRTRLMTFLSWLFLISLHSRNPVVLNGGDIYLRVILFWMLFLPWGHRWSWDAKKGQGDHLSWMPSLTETYLRGAASLGLTIQIASVYWFAALPKTDPSWMVDHSATSLVLRLDQFLTPIGYFFRDHFSGHLALLTAMVLLWEALGPFLLFFPFDRGQTRTFAVLGIMFMHLGFGTMLELGFFAWIGGLSPIVLLPAWAWERPLRRLTNWADRHLGVAGPCQGESWSNYARELLFVLIILFCFSWNMTNEKVTPQQLWLPERLNWIGHATRLDQRWNMFSPGPLTEDGWFVIDGRFRHGVALDLFNGGKPVSWEKPADVAHTYKNQRWRKYMMNLWLAENEKYRLPLGQYLCRVWNKKGRGPEELTEFDIVYMLEITNLDASEKEPEKRVIWHHWCFEKPADANDLKVESPEKAKDDSAPKSD